MNKVPEKVDLKIVFRWTETGGAVSGGYCHSYKDALASLHKYIGKEYVTYGRYTIVKEFVYDENKPVNNGIAKKRFFGTK